MNWQTEQYFKLSKVKEKLYKSSFNRINQEIKNSESFKNFILTPLKDMPNNFKYSFDSEEWNEFLEANNDGTYYDFLKYLTGKFSKVNLMSSETDHLIGWIAYDTVNDSVYNVKFGSLSLSIHDNRDLLLDVRKYLNELLEHYNIVSWFADKNNVKVVKYYDKLVNSFNGDSIGYKKEDNNIINYIIVKNINKILHK